MILKSQEVVDKNLTELVFSIDKADFDKAVNEAYRKNVKRMNIPGFRKGKAPKAIVEKMYGKGVFYEDALNALLPGEYEKALEESKIDAVSRPEFDVDDIGDEGVIVKAKVYTRPEAEVGDYEGIEAERELTPVTDEDVQRELERVQNRNSRTVEITDRAAARDDIANIDYKGYCDGKAFEGGEGKGYDLKLGSNSFIPGFEDQIIGHVIGDEFDVNVTFPEDYHAEELKGKPAVFKTKINAIKVTELPELDDEFAKDVSEFDTLDEYKADLRKNLEENDRKRADARVENAIVDKLIEMTTVDVPEAMYTAEVENYLRDFDNRLRMQGMDLSTYMKYTGMDLDGMRANYRPQAEHSVKARLALEAVARKENIEVTEEDLEKEYDTIAKQYNVELDKAKEIPADTLSGDIRVRKAVELVKSKAKITDTIKKDEPASEPAPEPAPEPAADAEAETAEAGTKAEE